jgi:hypothetical protein
MLGSLLGSRQPLAGARGDIIAGLRPDLDLPPVLEETVCLEDRGNARVPLPLISLTEGMRVPGLYVPFSMSAAISKAICS